MDSVRQSCRPKHQVLILKCYPKYQKGVQDVKPNPSELSYLLYYASTRRSKLQKVGVFLEKRTSRDVWRGKIGNVQVTLQILAALIEKLPHDLPLYATSVLTVIDTVIRSSEVFLVEESFHTFLTLCRHTDSNLFVVGHDYISIYREVICRYASFVSNDFVPPAKTSLERPLLLRWKKAGLLAIQAAVGSDALTTDGINKLDYLLPIILENIYEEDGRLIPDTQDNLGEVEHEDVNRTIPRRRSIATINTVDSAQASPSVAADTADADKRAESETRILALRCFQKVFSSGMSIVYLRGATLATLSFVVGKGNLREPSGDGISSWASAILDIMAKFAPVQDRFIILVAAMELLVNTPISDEKLDIQLSLALMVDRLLSGPNNLVGLSVNDVLIGLLQHLLLVLRLIGGKSRNVLHRRASSTFIRADGGSNTANTTTRSCPESLSTNAQTTTLPKTDDPAVLQLRQQLVQVLQKCIGDLVTHIYYSDQVSDTMKIIISRIKPNPSDESHSVEGSFTDTNTNRIGNGDPGGIETPQSRESSRRHFSFPSARLAALNCVKMVLVTANEKRDNNSNSRHRVSIDVWDGTQWLLRDPDHSVRLAYTDALTTWLHLETTFEDQRVITEHGASSAPRATGHIKQRHISEEGSSGQQQLQGQPQSQQQQQQEEPMLRSFVKNVPHRERPGQLAWYVLQSLHLCIYEAVLENAAEEKAISYLHLLLHRLVQHLGINSVQHGLPMILRLQEDVLGEGGSDIKAVVQNVSSLVYGYLLAIVKHFHVEDGTSAPVAKEIENEVSSRQQAERWTTAIQVPPLSLEKIQSLTPSTSANPSPSNINDYSIFTSLDDLVDLLESSYTHTIHARPASPTTPVHRPSVTSSLSINIEEGLPSTVKRAITTAWSKESVLASIESRRHNANHTFSRSNTNTLAHQPYSRVPSNPSQSMFNNNNNGNTPAGGGGGGAGGTGGTGPHSLAPEKGESAENLKSIFAGTPSTTTPYFLEPASASLNSEKPPMVGDLVASLQQQQLQQQLGSRSRSVSVSKPRTPSSHRENKMSLLSEIGGGAAAARGGGDTMSVRSLQISRPPY